MEIPKIEINVKPQIDVSGIRVEGLENGIFFFFAWDLSICFIYFLHQITSNYVNNIETFNKNTFLFSI